MRKQLISFFLVLLSLTLGATADVKSDVQKVDQQYMDARIKGDSKALEALLAPDFEVTTHKGVFLSRAKFLEYCKDRQLSLMEPINGTLNVRISGDTAVVTARFKMKGTDKKEGKIEQDAAATRVWVKQKGTWKLLSLHWHML